MTSFSSILVANRGEIALRIMRTAREMGLGCVAVYTHADADSPHVAFADQAICIGDGPVGDSYLSVDKIIGAARESGAEAIHPGYGFLSESAEFAKACIEAGLVFIGPSAEAIDLMGNKAAAKKRMLEAGVPCVPGYQGEDQSAETLAAEAEKLGYPVMIKAAAGGGGRGMRLVSEAAGFATALDLAKSEALSAFGSDEVILEKAVVRPRHVEIQVFADATGKTLHLGERDCSVQRRHQKVVEESPCPVMTPGLRAEMGGAAVEAAKAIDYRGAGTVEFLLDETGKFYFLEMNTRLQVEHPVTEMVTGQDLVAMQIRTAQGLPLALEQQNVELKGHAIEVRLYAEDPTQDFLPQSGQIEELIYGNGNGLRIDDGIVSGQVVSPFYDPMLAKIIAHGATRQEAMQKLVQELREFVLFGFPCNRDFLQQVLLHPEFAAGQATTAFIEDHAGAFIDGTLVSRDLALAVALHIRDQQARLGAVASVEDELLGWSSQGVLTARVKIKAGEDVTVAVVREQAGELHVSLGEASHVVSGEGEELRLDGRRVGFKACLGKGGRIHVATRDKMYSVELVGEGAASAAAGQDGLILAPMHGALLEVCVAEGDPVVPGTRLAVLEAMKMQHEILAEVAGSIAQVTAEAGSQVRAGELILEITKEGDAA